MLRTATRPTGGILTAQVSLVKDAGSSRRDNSILSVSATQLRALQAEFYDAIFGPESRVAWLIRDEGTVATVLGNDEFDARIFAGHNVGKRRYRDERIIL